MQQVTKSQKGTSEQLTLSPSLKNLKGLTKDETRMLEAKYTGPYFEVMTSHELFIAANELCIKMNIIVGWEIPGDKIMMNELFNQLAKHLEESFGKMTASEVELAFRTNTSVKDWGKRLNLALIDQVLSPYMEKRYDLSRKEEAARKPPETPKQIENIPMDDNQLLTAAFEVFKINRKHEFIPKSLFQYLVQKGKINLDAKQRDDIRDAVRRLIKMNVQNDREFAQTYLSLENKELFLSNESKKFAVAQYFNKLITDKKGI